MRRDDAEIEIGLVWYRRTGTIATRWNGLNHTRQNLCVSLACQQEQASGRCQLAETRTGGSRPL